jgi:hypothetical protein
MRKTKTKTVMLKDGPSGETWCKLRPVDGGDDTMDRAVILRGTFGAMGDVVAKPALLSWSEAGELVSPQKTVLSPWDLHPCEGSPRFEQGTLLEEVLDTQGSWNAAVALAREDEKLAKVLDELLADPDPVARPESAGEAA